MRTLPLIAVSKAHEWLHCHERGQNALMQVKGPPSNKKLKRLRGGVFPTSS